MELTLNPETEERLERRLREGRWKSPAEVMETALNLLDDLDDVIVLSHEELEAKIQEGIDSADRGELYTPEEARDYLAKLRAQLRQ